MRNISASCVPKCLNADQKPHRCRSSEEILEFFKHDPNDFLSWLVSTEESLLYYCDPETKQHSLEWRHSGSQQHSGSQRHSGTVAQRLTAAHSGTVSQRLTAAQRPTTQQKFPSAKIFWKISRLSFWDQEIVHHIDNLPKDHKINSDYYSSLLVQLKESLKEKRRWKLSKVVLFLKENSTFHWTLATQKKLAYREFQ